MYARRTPKAVFRRKLNVKTLIDYKNDSKNILYVNMVAGASFQSYSFNYQINDMFINY